MSKNTILTKLYFLTYLNFGIKMGRFISYKKKQVFSWSWIFGQKLEAWNSVSLARENGLNSTVNSNPRKCTITGIFELLWWGGKEMKERCFFRQFMFWNCGQIEFGSRGVVENICTEIVSQQIGREWIFARCTLLKTRRTLWILQQKENVCKVIKKNKNNIWKVILIFIWKITSKVSFFPLKKNS